MAFTTRTERWTRIPFYVVGEGTASALEEAFRGNGHHTFTLDIRGQKSGNAAVLAPFILNDVEQRPATLFYLSGDKNRDTIPRLLKEGGIELDTLQVYRTQAASSLGRMVSERVARYSRSNEPWWIACFAPSSTLFAFSYLQQHFSFREIGQKTDVQKGLLPTRIAAIGPTTESCLKSDLSLCVDVTAAHPTAEALLSVIQSFVP
ncbi:tetrapyrrole biosynthesis, uroporphyrinogen III synthase [Panaeolus papilionaceus]|nr:tetrapyrrole biosynthesis, uroporphyrinogen III synthase [Panaeolus papilionaceus]